MQWVSQPPNEPPPAGVRAHGAGPARGAGPAPRAPRRAAAAPRARLTPASPHVYIVTKYIFMRSQLRGSSITSC